MQVDEGRLQFSVGLDTAALARGAEEARRLMAGIGAAAEGEGSRLDAAFARARGAAASLFTAGAALGFAREMVGVRREIEGLEISFRTLLGSQQEADALFGRLRGFAARTPMALGDLAKAAQTMLGFGVASRDVAPLLEAIGDISMGDSAKFQALALAFSQASASGRLMGQDLMQMINAGFNPLAQISERTGRSVGELKEEMARGAIGADALRGAFLGAAAAGGRYHGMLEAQARGLGGSIAQLEGAWQEMLNAAGEAAGGAVAGAARGAAELLRRYREVGEILGALVGAYGAYRAAVMAAEAVRRVGQAARLREEAAALEGAVGAAGRAQLARQGLTRGTAAYAEAVRRLAGEEARLMQAELARAQAAVRGAAQAAAAKRGEYLAAKAREEAARGELLLARQGGTLKAAETAARRLEAATLARQTAAQEWLNASKAKEAQQTAVAAAARRASAASAALETAAARGAAAAHSLLARAKEVAAKASQRLGAALAANPYAIAAAALAALAYGAYRLATHQTEAQRAQRRLNEALEASAASAAAEQARVDALFGTLEGATRGTRAYEEAKGAIVAQYGEYLKGLGDERAALDDVAAAYEAVSQGVLRAARARAKEAYLAKEQEAFEKGYAKQLEALRETLQAKFGARGGNALLEELRPVLEGQRRIDEISAQARRRLAELNETRVRGGLFGDAADTYVDNRAERLIEGIVAAGARLKEAHRNAEAMFGAGGAGGARPGDAEGWRRRLEALREEEAALVEAERAGARGLALRRDIREAEEAIARLARPPKQNKAYWEARRKALQEELDALEAEAAAGARGLALRARIGEVDRRLAAYAAGGSGGAGMGGGDTRAGEDARAQELEGLNARREEEARRAALAVRQAEIDGMEEGFARELAVARLQYDRLREENARRGEEMAREARRAAQLRGDPGAAAITADTLPEPQRAQLAEYERINRESLRRAERAALAGALEEVMTYQQRRLKVEESYARRRRALYEEDGQRLREGVTGGNLEELARAEEEALAAVDAHFAERDATYRAWMGSLSQATLGELQAMLAQAREALRAAEAQAGGGDARLAQARARVAQLQRAVAEADARAGADAGRGAAGGANAWERLTRALAGAQRGFTDLGAAIGGATGEMLRGVGEVAGLAGSAIGGIQTLVTSSAQAMAAGAGAAAQAMAVVERGSLVLTVIATVAQIGMRLAELFDGSKELDARIKAQQASIDAMQWEIDNRDAAAMRDVWEATRAEVEALARAEVKARLEAGALAGAIAGGPEAFAAAQAEVAARAYGRTLGVVVDRLANVGYAAAQAFGTDRYRRAREDLEAMGRAILARTQQIDAERAKKRGKQDTAQIERWERENAQAAQRMAGTLRAATEDIMGGSAADLAQQLGDALVDAFRAGEDAAEAWGKKVDEIVAGIARRMLIKQALERPMAEAFDRLQRRVYRGGAWQEGELLPAVREFQRDMRASGEHFQRLMEAIGAQEDLLRGAAARGGAGAPGGAAARGIAAASQDSINELNGRMTAVQGHTFALMEGARVLQAACAGILESVRGIEGSAGRIEASLGRVEADAARTRRAVERVESEGVKAR